MYIETKLLSNIPIRQQGNNDWDVHLLRLVGNGHFRARSLLPTLEIFHPPDGWWLVVGGWLLVVAKEFFFLSILLREVAYILLPQAQQQPFLVSKLVEANILEVLNGYCESILHRLVALAPQGGEVGGQPQALHQLLNCLQQVKSQTGQRIEPLL